MELVTDVDAVEREHEPAAVQAFQAAVAGAAGQRNAADGRLVRLTAEALESGFWAGWRVHTPVQWLMWRAGLKRATARSVVLVASRADELPVTLRLLDEGRLSLDQAATVARYAPAAFEASVCELAVNASVAQIVAATRRYCFDAEAPADRPARPVERSVAFGADDGQWWARIRLAADEGAVVEEALQATRDRLHGDARDAAKDRAVAEGRSATGTDAALGVEEVGWADAMVGMARSTLVDGAGADASPVRTAVHLHLERPEPGCGEAWRAELHGSGLALPTWLRRYLLCDCDIEVVWTAEGTPVATSKHLRTPPRRLRRLVEHRDRYRCRVPGCDSTLWLQVHHLVHWEDGGETTTSNLCCLCARHHRMHHQGLLGIVGDADAPDGLIFTTEHGLALDPAGRPRAPEPGEWPEVAAYDGPTGERLQTAWVQFARTPDPDAVWAAAGRRRPPAA